MTIFYLSFALAVLSSVLYHVFQKATPVAVNPAMGLIITYLTALVFTILLLPYFPLKEGLQAELRKVNWASFALGIGIVGVEVGFLLAYRAGWNLSLASIAVNALSGVILLPSGVLIFKEQPSWVNVLVVFVCILGLVMVNSRQ